MSRRKTLQELTIKDNFMFAAVMLQEDHCRTFLEMTLGFPIERAEVSYEKSIFYHPEYKGVRLDVFAKDENHTHYNIEMQVVQQELGKRSRYYHSQMDMEMLVKGTPYEELSDAYVIFICDFDPFQDKKYCYTFQKICRENRDLCLGDGEHSIFLSTRGENPEDVPPEMVKFLNYVGAGLEESGKNFDDEFVSKLQKTVRHIKSSREMKEKYMLFEEMLRDERAEGRREGIREGRREGIREGKRKGLRQGRLDGKIESILDVLEEKGTVSDNVRAYITSESEPQNLSELLKAASKADTTEQFEQFIETLRKKQKEDI